MTNGCINQSSNTSDQMNLNDSVVKPSNTAIRRIQAIKTFFDSFPEEITLAVEGFEQSKIFKCYILFLYHSHGRLDVLIHMQSKGKEQVATTYS